MQAHLRLDTIPPLLSLQQMPVLLPHLGITRQYQLEEYGHARTSGTLR